MSNKSDGHAKNTIDRLEKDVFPWIGKTAITDIEAPDVLAVLRRIEQRGANELAHMAKRVIGQVFRYAIATGRTIRTPPFPICKAQFRRLSLRTMPPLLTRCKSAHYCARVKATREILPPVAPCACRLWLC
ncbi:MAG: tyrosine-type recombinase/integrase [Methylococcaceae bacterium]